MLFRKIYRGQIFPIQVVLLGEIFDSVVAKKKPSLISCSDGKDIKVLLSNKISIGDPRCQGPQVTVTDCLCTVIDSNSSTRSTLSPYAPLVPQGTHLRIRVGRDIFVKIQDFRDTNAALWPIVTDF